MKKIFIFLIISIFTISPVLVGCTTIRTPPPPARVDIRPAPPFSGAIWIEGHWKHKHGEWVWKPGYWAKKPGPKSVWVKGHWQKRPWGWKWVPGHWRR
jgi:hypothetical protein